MDEDIQRIWAESQAEHEAILRVGQGVQDLSEETIGNIAALQLLNEDTIEQTVKNS